FVDGNKRVGITAAAIFLQRNGQRLTATNEAVEAFTLSVAQGKKSMEEITAWFAGNTLRRFAVCPPQLCRTAPFGARTGALRLSYKPRHARRSGT
ncbi:MAG: hypothetical protein KDD77_16375, partial [Caldilineaceae bacterium]|nr:hypothetical protein [Caldilineaceae bacterium]